MKPLQIDPRKGTSKATAEANQALVMWELEQTNFKQELIYFLFDLLLYGTGNLWWGFVPMERRKRRKVRRGVAPVLGEGKKAGEAQPGSAHGPAGHAVPHESGQGTELVDEETTDTWVLPKVEYCHIRHY